MPCNRRRDGDWLLMAERRGLLVGSEEGGDFAADEADEGAGEHLFGVAGRVLVVVIRVGQHLKQSLYQLLILGAHKQTNKQTNKQTDDEMLI